MLALMCFMLFPVLFPDVLSKQEINTVDARIMVRGFRSGIRPYKMLYIPDRSLYESRQKKKVRNKRFRLATDAERVAFEKSKIRMMGRETVQERTILVSAKVRLARYGEEFGPVKEFVDVYKYKPMELDYDELMHVSQRSSLDVGYDKKPCQYYFIVFSRYPCQLKEGMYIGPFSQSLCDRLLLIEDRLFGIKSSSERIAWLLQSDDIDRHILACAYIEQAKCLPTLQQWQKMLAQCRTEEIRIKGIDTRYGQMLSIKSMSYLEDLLRYQISLALDGNRQAGVLNEEVLCHVLEAGDPVAAVGVVCTFVCLLSSYEVKADLMFHDPGRVVRCVDQALARLKASEDKGPPSSAGKTDWRVRIDPQRAVIEQMKLFQQKYWETLTARRMGGYPWITASAMRYPNGQIKALTHPMNRYPEMAPDTEIELAVCQALKGKVPTGRYCWYQLPDRDKPEQLGDSIGEGARLWVKRPDNYIDIVCVYTEDHTMRSIQSKSIRIMTDGSEEAHQMELENQKALEQAYQEELQRRKQAVSTADGKIGQVTDSIRQAGKLHHSVSRQVNWRIDAFDGDSGLAWAIGYYNVCSLKQTDQAVGLVARALAVKYPKQPGLVVSFKMAQLQRQSAAACLKPARWKPADLAYLQLPADQKDPMARVNVLLLNNQCAQALALARSQFEQAGDAESRARWADAIARSLRAVDGGMGRANAWIAQVGGE